MTTSTKICPDCKRNPELTKYCVTDNYLNKLPKESIIKVIGYNVVKLSGTHTRHKNQLIAYLGYHLTEGHIYTWPEVKGMRNSHVPIPREHGTQFASSVVNVTTTTTPVKKPHIPPLSMGIPVKINHYHKTVPEGSAILRKLVFPEEVEAADGIMDIEERANEEQKAVRLMRSVFGKEGAMYDHASEDPEYGYANNSEDDMVLDGWNFNQSKLVK